MEQKTVCNTGVIQKVEGNMIYVLMEIHSACAGCHAKSICIPSHSKNELLKIKNDENLHFEAGEKVKIEMERKLGGKALRIGYLYPCILFIAAIFIVYRVTGHELIAAFLAFAVVALYYFLIYLFNRKKKIDRQFVFHVRKEERH